MRIQAGKRSIIGAKTQRDLRAINQRRRIPGKLSVLDEIHVARPNVPCREAKSRTLISRSVKKVIKHEDSPRLWSQLGGWLFMAQAPDHSCYSTQALASAILRGYSDVVANLIKSGINWRELSADELSAMYGLISDPELKSAIAAWAVASELEGPYASSSS